VGVLFIVSFLIAALYGCPTQDGETEWGWKAKRPQRMQDTFSHEVHKKVFEKEGFGCSVCHTMGIEIPEEMEEKKMVQISEEAFFPGKETCHFCHYNPQAGNRVPDECGVCHFNLREIQPANHNFDWMAKHAVFAKADEEDCQSCHSPRFCEDCHKRRDLPTLRFHDRNFRFVHAIEARANPRACGNCHELKSFCVKCHTEGGYDR
jgi:hypothetical protein